MITFEVFMKIKKFKKPTEPKKRTSNPCYIINIYSLIEK